MKYGLVAVLVSDKLSVVTRNFRKSTRNRILSIAIAGLVAIFFYENHSAAQTPPKTGMKHILVISQTKGFQHDSIPNAMGTIWKMGHDTKLWEATLRTDTELITKKDIPRRNVQTLNSFDALVFASTTGELDLEDSQKSDMMSSIKDDGKGFVGIHAALDTNYKWPEYGEMIGGTPGLRSVLRLLWKTLSFQQSGIFRMRLRSTTRFTNPNRGHATR